ncbi:hypothetical protein ABID19_006846 [Mesorhizobium robiniae]|uniref:Uncharacterized protein n=1 Tax=Mesorhizobium robiniae TaxID=559315 RepID=A0ABV2GZR5_9HYPH
MRNSTTPGEAMFQQVERLCLGQCKALKRVSLTPHKPALRIRRLESAVSGPELLALARTHSAGGKTLCLDR